ncbi:MAG TPA: flagellar hook-length control protein FliK [Candidatus Hydrogenedentes bacterium]|nr:flagellar hook-length control protein FliK [Candidatus Hydrogenedentota bacterium]
MYIEMMQQIQPEVDAANLPLSEGSSTSNPPGDMGFAQIFTEALSEGSSTPEDPGSEEGPFHAATGIDWSQALALMAMAMPVTSESIQTTVASTIASAPEESASVTGERMPPAAVALPEQTDAMLEMVSAATEESLGTLSSVQIMDEASALPSNVVEETALPEIVPPGTPRPLVVADLGIVMTEIPETQAVQSTAEYKTIGSPAHVVATTETPGDVSPAVVSKAEYVVLPSLAAKETPVHKESAGASESKSTAGETKAGSAGNPVPGAVTASSAEVSGDTPMPPVTASKEAVATEPAQEAMSSKPWPSVEVKPLPPPDLAPSKTTSLQPSVNPALFAQTLESDAVAQRVQEKTVARAGEDLKAASDTTLRIPAGSTEAPSAQTPGAPMLMDPSKASSTSLASPMSDTPAPSGQATLQTLDAFTVKSVRYLAGRGENMLSVRLIPESLGEMHIEVHSRGDDLTIRLVSANPVVRDTLQSQLPGLRDALSQDGLEVGQVEIASTTSQNAGQGSWNSQQAGQQNMPARVPTYYTKSYADPVQTVLPTFRQLPAHQGSLNVFV